MKRTCPICNTLFEPAVPHQEYDRLSCRKRAERHRARLRDKGVSIQMKSHYGAADHANFLNPTEKDLIELGGIYLNNPSALPTYCQGVVPTEWQPPPGVIFTIQHQMGGQPSYWMMCSQIYLDAQFAAREALKSPEVAAAPRKRAEDVLNAVLPMKDRNDFEIPSDLEETESLESPRPNEG